MASRLAPPTLFVFVEAGWHVARACVPKGQLDLFPVGKQVRVKVDGRGYPGTVRFVGLEEIFPVEGKKESCLPVDVTFRVSGPLLRAGRGADIELP